MRIVPRHAADYFVLAAWAALATAGCGGSSSTAPTTTTTAALQSVSLSPTSVSGGLVVTGTVTLTSAAPAGGALVSLTSSSAAAAVPASVTIAAGSSSQTFEIDTVASSAATTATVTASYSGVNQTATLAIGRLALQDLTLSTSSVVGGTVVTGTVTLAAAASAGGVLVSLSSSSPSVSVPPSVTIASGATSQTFDIATLDVATPATAAITATVAYSGSSRTATLAVGRLALQSVWLGIGSLPGGVPLTGLVMLTVAAPAGGVTVSLTSSGPAALVPSLVTVAAGNASQAFDITTVNAPPTTTVTITASYAGNTQTATLTVIALPSIVSFSCTPSIVVGGNPLQCTGTLANPAPAGGWQLALSSSDSSATLPSTANVPASSLTFHFNVTTVPVSISTAVTIQIADAPSGSVLFTQALSITQSPGM